MPVQAWYDSQEVICPRPAAGMFDNENDHVLPAWQARGTAGQQQEARMLSAMLQL